MLTANSCISRSSLDSITSTVNQVRIQNMDDKVKVYNFIKEQKYDSAKIFLEEEFNQYLLNSSEYKGFIEAQKFTISKDCKEEVIAASDSSINRVQDCLKSK